MLQWATGSRPQFKNVDGGIEILEGERREFPVISFADDSFRVEIHPDEDHFCAYFVRMSGPFQKNFRKQYNWATEDEAKRQSLFILKSKLLQALKELEEMGVP